MWDSAQRDGHPAKYRWRLLFNGRKVWLMLTTRVLCNNAAKTWNLLKFAGVPKLTNRCQLLVGGSSPYYEDIWRRYCCLTSFFPTVNTRLSCEDTAWQSCAIVPIQRFFGDYLHPVFSVSRVQYISDLHSKFALKPHHVWKYGRHPICDGWDEARKRKKIERWTHRTKICPHLLHRVAITNKKIHVIKHLVILKISKETCAAVWVGNRKFTTPWAD